MALKNWLTIRPIVAAAVVTALAIIGTLRYLQAGNVAVPHYVYVTGALLVITIVGAALLYLTATTDLLRDSFPSSFGLAEGPHGATLRRPYSLAQTQMAWWFFLVFAAFIYLLLTGEDATISNQALALMGIGTGTALGAAAIEQNKTDPLHQLMESLVTQANNAKLNLNAGAKNPFLGPLEDVAQKLASQNFLADILTDVDGVALHRFQVLVWTVVLGAIFAANVVIDKKMPEFKPELIALLGVSGGAYLGFKIPEKPA